MQVTAVFTAQLKAALGRGSDVVRVPANSTIQIVMDQLAADHPDVFARLVFDDDGNLLPSMLICLNDEQVMIHDAPQLQDGDTITLLSAISGG